MTVLNSSSINGDDSNIAHVDASENENIRQDEEGGRSAPRYPKQVSFNTSQQKEYKMGAASSDAKRSTSDIQHGTEINGVKPSGCGITPTPRQAIPEISTLNQIPEQQSPDLLHSFPLASQHDSSVLFRNHLNMPPRTSLDETTQDALPAASQVRSSQIRPHLSPTTSDLQISPRATTATVSLEDKDLTISSGYSARRSASSMMTNGTTNRVQKRPQNLIIDTSPHTTTMARSPNLRPSPLPRALSTPASIKSPAPSQVQQPSSRQGRSESKPENIQATAHQLPGSRPLPSPMPTSLPLPPMSMPTYLQLELSSQRPPPLHIHRSAFTDFPYESSRVKIERLLNFLFLPFHLEGVLWFGTIACLDAWLYTFTILPLRLLKSFYILAQSWVRNLTTETHFLFNFVYSGIGRMWLRQRIADSSTSSGRARTPSAEEHAVQAPPPRRRVKAERHHRRTKSVPSMLLPNDKADILKGLLIICTCLLLLRLDASRMYHWVRGQAAVKLYVIYNVLEVCDRLLSAIGQDVLECLFSREALERKPDGHSKILRPFWLFVLALVYTVVHSTALFYQVITLNVAVNSYSNALITLLMSNQFVEIKSTVFKKFEKENLFQLTCADVVERFQLWHMLLIIAARNVVETGELNIGWSAMSSSLKSASSMASTAANSTHTLTQAIPPRSVSSILPQAFTMVPAAISSMTSYIPVVGTIVGPFLVVLGSEMLVDWIKHAYINKFNNARPAIYGRFLDVLAKDYYTNAFGDQNLSKRLGLPIIPLSCLMIRASFQTYQMFQASWFPAPSASTTANLASIQRQYSTSRATAPMTTTAAISRTFEDLLNQIPLIISNSRMAAHFTSILIALLVFLILLACKLMLGMLLLSFARSRYRSMKEREQQPLQHVEGGRRAGGWGVVEVDEDKKRWIYDDDPAGFQALKEREAKEKAKQDKEKRGFEIEAFDKIQRYEMVAKRIW